jgi:hypothetical protein
VGDEGHKEQSWPAFKSLTSSQSGTRASLFPHSRV